MLATEKEVSITSKDLKKIETDVLNVVRNIEKEISIQKQLVMVSNSIV